MVMDILSLQPCFPVADFWSHLAELRPVYAPYKGVWVSPHHTNQIAYYEDSFIKAK